MVFIPFTDGLFNSLDKIKVVPLAVFILLSSLNPTFATENSVGTIIGISGTIEYYQSTNGEPVAEAKPGEVQRVSFGTWEKAQFHQEVYAKDKFRTFRKSRLKILLSDKSLIALGPNSEMTVKSYLYSKKDKLRQAVIGVAHGFSMYIVNKSQTNKKSSFKIVTPTANISARGTQGYIASSPNNTYTANRVGKVLTSNVNPNISGVVELGPLMGNNIPVDGPPTKASPIAPNSMKHIQNFVMGLMAQPSGGGKNGRDPLIDVQGSKEDGRQKNPDENGGQEMLGTDFSGGFFAPENNPFPDGPDGGDFMTSCTM